MGECGKAWYLTSLRPYSVFQWQWWEAPEGEHTLTIRSPACSRELWQPGRVWRGCTGLIPGGWLLHRCLHWCQGQGLGGQHSQFFSHLPPPSLSLLISLCSRQEHDRKDDSCSSWRLSRLGWCWSADQVRAWPCHLPESPLPSQGFCAPTQLGTGSSELDLGEELEWRINLTSGRRNVSFSQKTRPWGHSCRAWWWPLWCQFTCIYQTPDSSTGIFSDLSVTLLLVSAHTSFYNSIT